MSDLFTPPAAQPLGLLAPPFDCASPGSRAPYLIDPAERLAEITRELAERRRAYPRRVAAGRLTQLRADHEIAVMAAIEADCRAATLGPGPAIGWRAKLDCLRREIALRRNLYPKWIDAGRLDRADARRQLERVEAVHHAYWAELWWWDGAPCSIWSPGSPDYATAEPARNQVRAHFRALDQLQQKEAA